MSKPKLPEPKRPLPSLRRDDMCQLRRGTALYRVYHAAGRYPAAWNALRTYGPTTARFDPHLPPPHEQERGVLYAAGSMPTALVEVFQDSRNIERSRDEPWLVGFKLAAALQLLDLTGAWPTRAGACQAISSDERKNVTRVWAQAIYREYGDVAGVVYPSSMAGLRRRSADPRLHGLAMALFDRASASFPVHPIVHLPLIHAGLNEALADAAERYGYDLVD